MTGFCLKEALLCKLAAGSTIAGGDTGVAEGLLPCAAAALCGSEAEASTVFISVNFTSETKDLVNSTE